MFEPGAAATFRYIYAGMDGGAAAAGERDSAVSGGSGEYIYNGGGGGNDAAAGEYIEDRPAPSEVGGTGRPARGDGYVPGEDLYNAGVELYGEGGRPGRQASLDC